MCGIVGIVRIGEHDCLADVRAALNAIAHRGPDDYGVWSTISDTDQRFSTALGHVRLAILDLSPSGHQPMVSSHGMVIVFNGEIYNYLELREQLCNLGHQFSTETDTEVILASYRQWGERCVEYFIGMWAFAIWDGKRLFLSRDRMGKKPLYFYHDPATGFLAFASEIKGLRLIEDVKWKPDEETVFRFLAFAEMERNGATFYHGIRELPAATWLFYTPDLKELQPRSYWTLSNEEYDIGEFEALTKTSELLYDSLRLRLRSDAPLGLSLSGGLDSTLLLALMNEAGFEKPPVFSSGYNESGYNESRYIEIASRYLGCQPHATLSDASLFRNDFERFIYHLDQPSKLPSPYSQWRVVELAQKTVKVLIDGQGADELAGGYMYFLPAAWRETSWISKIRYAPDLALTLWGNRYMLQQYSPAFFWERLRGKAKLTNLSCLQNSWKQRYSAKRPYWESSTRHGLNTALRSAVTATSLPALLRYGDRVTMAFGVENRCPFLDHRLIEFVSALPAHFKIRGGTTKWIFREIAKNRIPNAIIKRRMKMGFPTPVGVWLKKEILESAREWLKNYSSYPYFNKWIYDKEAYRVLSDHASGKGEHQALLWRILAVGAWLKTSQFK